MATPKGMRTMAFSINDTDSVHIYSEPQRIWLQFRRDVPTQQNISQPSFKTAIDLTPAQAIAIAGELLTAATSHQSNAVSTKPEQNTGIGAGTPANHGKPWTSAEDKKLTSAFDARTSIPELARTHQRGIGGVQSRLTKLGKLAPDQHQTFTSESK
jgi:hypothetical protein